MSDPEFQRRLRATFQAEASDHIRALAADAAALERTAAADEQLALVERMFRETHTLKGAARMVGEADAEALCHALEQHLSQLKQAKQAVPADGIAAVRAALLEIAASLRTPLAPVAVAVPAAAEKEAPMPTVAAAGNVRVAGARLDTLLMRAEEMVGAKLSAEQHIGTLAALTHRGRTWKRELDRVRSEIGILRRYVDGTHKAPVVAELTSVLHYLDWTHEFVRELHGDVARLSHQAGADQRRLSGAIDRLLDDAKELLMQPFSSLLEAFPAFVEQIATQQGKDIDLVIEGAATEIDRRVLEEIRDALIHLVRNSVDHGIEPAADRAARGKPARGRLTISVVGRAGGTVEIAVSDDGRGIDPAEVTASARRLGLITPDAPELRDHDALSLLFQSGFSTKSATTDLSGRGLGLAIVREKAERIGGSVTLESEPNRGSTFRIHVPLTLARFRGLFVATHQQTFVIPTPYVRRVVRLPEASLRRVKAQTVADLEGNAIAVLALGDAIGLSSPTPPAIDGRANVFLVLIESGHSLAALRVDDVPYEEEVVMKSVGPLLRGARQYIGATIGGGGRVVPVLNVGHLLAASVFGSAPQRSTGSAAKTERRQRTILVVEDSITSRSLLKGILQAAGYQVRTAVDGVDAITVLKFEAIDLVISDVQMPRMNGFELTEKIRRDQALSTLPVILITSLASREDREHGVDVGANAYIVKGNFDQSDLLESIRRLLP